MTADDSSKPTRPLTRENVAAAHERIRRNIHLTPVMTCQTLSHLASTPQTPEALRGTEYEGRTPTHPRMRLFFKCENQQKIGAFKARGAFHALSRLMPGQLENGVITHSSGNHAQALALAARTRNIPAHIIMPTISTPSKIAATKAQNAHVYFSGSTAPEREALVAEVQARTGALLVPPYDHADIILGQGTAALEFESQVKELTGPERGVEGLTGGAEDGLGGGSEGLDAVIAPCGGGGLLSGTATALQGTGLRVFGAEPSYQGADDCKRGLAQGARIEKVNSLTIADGVRTPVGLIPWSVISDKTKVHGVFSVSEIQIKEAMRLLFERAKVVVEPCAALGLAVALYDEDFRGVVERETEEGEAWNVGVILSGGNTTMEMVGELFRAEAEGVGEREEGKVGMDGERIAENVAG